MGESYLTEDRPTRQVEMVYRGQVGYGIPFAPPSLQMTTGILIRL